MWAGLAPDKRLDWPTGSRAGEGSERSPWHNATPQVAWKWLPQRQRTCAHFFPPRHDTPDLLTFDPRRAEEEDEHLERTLEQNKGKMAKKEEKCVLQ